MYNVHEVCQWCVYSVSEVHLECVMCYWCVKRCVSWVLSECMRGV